jgi:hypothetical protein
MKQEGAELHARELLPCNVAEGHDVDHGFVSSETEYFERGLFDTARGACATSMTRSNISPGSGARPVDPLDIDSVAGKLSESVAAIRSQRMHPDSASRASPLN